MEVVSRVLGKGRSPHSLGSHLSWVGDRSVHERELCQVALTPGSGWSLTLLVSGTSAFLPFLGILGPQDFCTACSLSLEHTFPPRAAP